MIFSATIRRAGRLAAVGACLIATSGTAQEPVNPLRQSPPPAEAQGTPAAQPGIPAAAPPREESNSARERAVKIYELTKAAQSIEEFSQIIELCQAAQQEAAAPEEQTYLRQLVAWALNRRGEAWIVRSAEPDSGEQEAAEAEQQALADFNAAIKADPNRWKALHNRGVSQAIAGRLAEALQDFNRVVELQPEYVNVWFNRAEVHYELKQYAAAEQDYVKSLALRSDDLAARTGLAHCRFQQGRFEEALADYSAVVAGLPGDLDAVVDRGEAYQAVGQWEQAALDYQQALALTPLSPRALASASWFMATCPEPRFRAPQKAVQLAEQALSLVGDPTPRLLDTLAAAQANAGDFASAVQNAEDALQLAGPDESQGLTERLDSYRRQQPFRQSPSKVSLAANSGR